MKKKIYQFHGWLGLNFGLVLFIICLSGTFATISHEIDWLCNPAIRVTPSEDHASWATMVAVAEEYADDAAVRYCRAPLGTRFAAEFWTKDSRGNTRRIYVDPYRGKATGEATWMNSQRFFRDFHRRFYVTAGWGIWLVSAFAFVLSSASITGLMFYARWWTRLFVLRSRLGFRMFFSDLHRLFGLWTLIFSLIISATGLWYLIEKAATSKYQEIRRAAEENSSVDESSFQRRKPQITPDGPKLSIDVLVDNAQAEMPGLKVKSISMSIGEKQAVRVSGQATAWLVRNRTNWVSLDPYTGRVLEMEKAEDLSAFERWTHTADPLHFGNFAGLTSKLIWFFFGLMISTLIPTGAWLWIKRRSVRVAQKIRANQSNGIDMLTTIHKSVRRQYWAGILSTVAILVLSAMSTWEALAKQYYSLSDDGDIRGLGEPAAIAVWGTFIVFVLFASSIWFRWIWLPSIQLLAMQASAELDSKQDTP